MANKYESLIIKDERSVFIDSSVKMGKNIVIYENNRIEGNTIIGDNVCIMPGCYINNCEIGNNVKIISSHIEEAKIGNSCNVGPFARLRPKTVLKDNVKIGNFVEIKNSVIGHESKISHLAYVGDVDMGENCNVGCGAIFVNYNGKTKSRTKVGDRCFIGSNCNIIAPVEIGDGCYICAGTTVTENVVSDGFVIGRVKQQVKPLRAKKYLNK